LNDSQEIVKVRFIAGEQLCETLNEIYQKANEYLLNGLQDVRIKNRILRGTRNILKQAQPQAEYSGIIATVLLNEDEYIQLKSILVKLNFWDNELEELHQMAESIKYDVAI